MAYAVWGVFSKDVGALVKIFTSNTKAWKWIEQRENECGRSHVGNLYYVKGLDVEE